MPATTTKLVSRDTVYSADSTEWCPNEGHHNVLAVGTYQVDKDKDEENLRYSRRGRIYLQHDTDDAFVSQLDFPAVLDMKWGHGADPVLAVADCESNVTFLDLVDDGRELRQRCQLRLKDEGEADTLALSLDWSDRREATVAPRIVASDSKGRAHVLSASSSGLESVFCRRCHDFEAWIAAFDAWDADVEAI